MSERPEIRSALRLAAWLLSALCATAAGAQGDDVWGRALDEAATDPKRVAQVLAAAGAAEEPAAQAFLQGLANGFPRGAWSTEALDALGGDRRFAYVDYVLTLARGLSRPQDKLAALAFIERSPPHRDAGLLTLLELFAGHRSDPYGLGVLALVGQYLTDGASAETVALIADAAFDAFADVSAGAGRAAAWQLASSLPLGHRLPFLAAAVETFDPVYATEAAAILLRERVEGAEDLLAVTITADMRRANESGLLDAVASAPGPLLALRILEEVDYVSWADVSRIHDVLARGHLAQIEPYLLSALRSGAADPKRLALAMKVLADLDRTRASAHVRPYLEVGDVRLKLLAHAVLADLTRDGTWWDRAVRFLEAGDDDARLDRLEALLDVAPSSPFVRAWVGRSLAERGTRWKFQGALLALASAVGVENLTDVVRPFLEHPRWQIRLAAIETLERHGERRALPLLAVATGEERLRLARAAAGALHRLTGENLGTAPEAWGRYLAGLPDDWTPPRRAPRQDAADGRYGPRFYGLDLGSNRVSFVCDVSGSMAGPKLESMRRELVGAIDSLDETGAFNVIFFSTGVHAIWQRLAKAVPRVKRRARERVQRQEVAGGTNLFGGLEDALDDESADTIVVLTDGQPTAGRFTAHAEILAAVRRENRYKRMQIHTVYVDHDAGVFWPFLRDPADPGRLMHDLAEQNEGRFARAPVP